MSTENTTNTENEFYDDDPIMNMAFSSTNPPPAEGTEQEEQSSEEPKEGEGNTEEDDKGSASPESDSEETKDQESQAPAFDVSKYLEEHSGGLLKSEEDLKASVAKIQENDTLRTRIAELEAEKESIFANEEIKLLNDLSKQGKTEEQIEEFRKLRKLGDLSAVDPKEILVQNLVSKGTSRSVAERLIEREYGLNSINLNGDELTDEELASNKEEHALILEKMRLDADPIRKEMQSQIEAFSKPVDQTQQALEKVAAEKAYKQKLAPFAEKLAGDFPSKIEIIEGVEIDVTPEFKESVKSIALEHFLDREVNNENVAEFLNVQKAIFFAENKEVIFKAVHDKGKEEGKAETEARFVNNNGLERSGAVFTKESDKMSEEEKISYAMEIAKD